MPQSEVGHATLSGSRLPVRLVMFGFAAIGALVAVGLAAAVVAQLVPADAHMKTVPAPAVLAGKTVYLGTDGGVYALDARIGAVRWRYPASGAAGPKRVTSVALGDETLYAATMNGPVLALRMSDGALLWSSDVVRESNAPTLAYADGMVYAAAHVGTHQAAGDKLLAALRATDGREQWRFTADEPILSAPTIGAGAVFFGTTDRLVYAVDARTGALRWKSPRYSAGDGGHHLEGFIHARPLGIALLARGDKLYVNAKIEHRNDASKSYIESSTGALYADGTGIMGTGLPHEDLPMAYVPIVVDGLSYFEAGGGLWATRVDPLGNPTGGWYHDSGGTQYTGPTVGEGRIYSCTFNGYTYALGIRDGGELWHTKTGGGVLNQPPMFAGSAVFVSGASAVYALRASDGAQIWRAVLSGDTVRLTPMVR